MRDILRPVFKWWCQIVFITVIALVAGTLAAFLIPPDYIAKSRILVKRTSLDNDDMPGDRKSGITSNLRQLNQKDDINTVIAIIESSDLIREVIKDMGLTMKQLDYIPDYRYYVRLIYKGAKNLLKAIWNNTKYLLHIDRRPTEEELQALRQAELSDAVKKAMKVKQITDSDVIMVSVGCGDRLLARKIADAICRHAITWHNRKRTQSETNLRFFSGQARNIRAEILKLDSELRKRQDPSEPISATLKKQLIVEDQIKAESKLNEALARRDALRAGIRQLEQELEQIKSEITVSSDTAVNPVWLGIEKKLAGYKLELAEKRTKFSDDSRVVQDLIIQVKETQKLMSDIKRSIARSRTRGMNTVHQKLEETLLSKRSQLAATEAEIARRRVIISNHKNRLLQLNKLALEASLRKIRKATMEKAYKLYVENSEQARLNHARQDAQLANLVIVQHATLPLKAAKPVKWLYILVSASAGLLAGLTWAFIKDFNDTTYWNPDQLAQDLGMAVIGTIQDESVAGDKKAWMHSTCRTK